MADRLRCVVERITYQNPDNGYSVITEEYDVHRDNKGEEGTCCYCSRSLSQNCSIGLT